MTLSLLAIEIDDENRWLMLYASFSVIGYNQFLDLILFKSLYDVLGNREMHLTFADRPDRIEGLKLEYRPSLRDSRQPAGVGQDGGQRVTQEEPTRGTQGSRLGRRSRA